jgi:hypothetical protein
MASVTHAKNYTVFNTGSSKSTWISPQRGYVIDEAKTEYPKICLDFLAVKIVKGKVTFINETKGCKHGLNGTRGGSCSNLHNGCFYYLQEGRPIKTNAHGCKRLIKCKNGNKCNKSHNICRNCCYATQRFVPLHTKEECPNRGFYNKLLKKNGYKTIKNVYLKKSSNDSSEIEQLPAHMKSHIDYAKRDQAVIEQFKKLKNMVDKKFIYVMADGHPFEVDVVLHLVQNKNGIFENIN